MSGRLAYLESQFDISLKLLKKSESIDPELQYSTYNAATFKYLSDSYEKVGDLKSALKNNRLYNLYADSLNNKRNLKAAVYLLMNDNLRKSETLISKYKERQLFLYGFITVFLIFITILGFFYFKLRFAYKILFRKNLEVTILRENRESRMPEANIFNTSLATCTESMVNNYQLWDSKNKVQSKLKKKSKENCLLAKLEILVNEKKIYRETYLTLESLAKELGTNRTNLSNFINDNLGFSFNTYINNCRIAEVLEILRNNQESGDISKLDTVFKNVGFSNRTTFIAAFKEYTGLTPSVFMKKLSEKIGSD